MKIKKQTVISQFHRGGAIALLVGVGGGLFAGRHLWAEDVTVGNQASQEETAEKVEVVDGKTEVTTKHFKPPSGYEFKRMDDVSAERPGVKVGRHAHASGKNLVETDIFFEKDEADDVQVKYMNLPLDPLNADQWDLLAWGRIKPKPAQGGGGGGKALQEKPWEVKTKAPAIVTFAVDRDGWAPGWIDERLLAPGEGVYSGNVTGDRVRFKAINTHTINTRFTWSAKRLAPTSPQVAITGPSGLYVPNTPPDPSEWRVDTMKWLPGTYEIRCDIVWEGQTTTVKAKQEVGVRTDDVVVVGWIDPDAVPLPVAGVQPKLLRVLPVSGFKEADSNLAKLKAAFLVKYVSENSVDGNFSTGDLPMATLIGTALGGPGGAIGGAVLNAAIKDNFKGFSAEDKKYMICWMFKYGANTSPDVNDGGNFQDSATPPRFSQAKLDAYIAKNPEHTHFKLMNHFQVKFLTDAAHAAPIPFKADTLKYVQHEVALGNTKDPTRFYDLKIPYAITRPMGYHDEGVFPGKPSALNGTQTIGGNNSIVSQYNEGSPDQKAMDAFTHLHGSLVNFNIWSRINFFSDLVSYHETISPTTHVSLTRAPKPTHFYQGQTNTQLYPTYWIYINGETRPEWKHAQHADPLELIKQKDNAQ